MTTTLEQLLVKYPKAVAAVDQWNAPRKVLSLNAYDAINSIREYAYMKEIATADDCGMLSLADLLAVIESHLTATEPLTDEEIELMKWTHEGGVVGPSGYVSFHAYNAEDAANAVACHNADIDRLHAEIRRLREAAP